MGSELTNISNGTKSTEKVEKIQVAESEDEILQKSICVRNVEYTATVEELKEHFKDCCGNKGIEGIKKITILTDKHSGHPIGQAYITFET